MVSFETVDVSSGHSFVFADPLATKSIRITKTHGNIRRIFAAEMTVRGQRKRLSGAGFYNRLGFNRMTITGRHSILPSSPRNTGGGFDVSVGSQSLINLVPLESTLTLFASAPDVPISVDVPNSFEGTLSLSSARNTVGGDKNATDPRRGACS